MITQFTQKKVFIASKISKAFTLLELLVAMAIFAIISIMAYTGLNIVLATHYQTEQYATQQKQLAMAFNWLGRDIGQLVARPIRNQYGDKQAILQGSSSTLEFTRAGWNNPAKQKRSNLQRVAYIVEDRILWRLYWWVLDRAQDTTPYKVELLTNIDDFAWRYLDEQLVWHQQWLPLNTININQNLLLLKPKAIEVSLTIENWGEITRLFATSY
ncbi:MAG: type II secretion system minor pseudopilin GspJ [Thiomargarita sp.]|nr:type II secretion system minor pseudopilin GspJ [Thiomargarita sp.]